MSEQSRMEVQEINDHVHFSLIGLLHKVFDNAGVKAARDKALAAGIPLPQILAVILPILMQVLSGKPIDFSAIIAAILALITPTPKP